MKPFRHAKLLVTGGAGFMGSDFIKHILAKDDFDGTIVNLDALTYAGNLANLKEIDGDPRYTFIHGDICDEKLLEELFHHHHIDYIVHFAAESHVDRSIDQPKSFIDTNITGTYNLLEQLRRHPHMHMHLISTDEVYGDLPASGFFTEMSNYAPSSPYSASKAAADHLTKAYARTFGLSVTISHASNNYGPHQHKEKLIPRMVTRCLSGEILTIYGSGEQVRDWLYVKDHSSAIAAILCSGKKGEVYNVGGGHERTNLEVVHQIIDCVSQLKGIPKKELESRIKHVADRPGHDFRYAMDITKIRKEIGWEPKMSFNEGLRLTVQEMLA
jgi:dTDP-glucose 4,6-dehydratase